MTNNMRRKISNPFDDSNTRLDNMDSGDGDVDGDR